MLFHATWPGAYLKGYFSSVPVCMCVHSSVGRFSCLMCSSHAIFLCYMCLWIFSTSQLACTSQHWTEVWLWLFICRFWQAIWAAPWASITSAGGSGLWEFPWWCFQRHLLWVSCLWPVLVHEHTVLSLWLKGNWRAEDAKQFLLRKGWEHEVVL